jgi:hypothetical protein
MLCVDVGTSLYAFHSKVCRYRYQISFQPGMEESLAGYGNMILPLVEPFTMLWIDVCIFTESLSSLMPKVRQKLNLITDVV